MTSAASAPERLVLGAPAKVNLTLAVGARQADGYHVVDTVCLALELADRLEVRRGAPGDALALNVDGPAAAGVPADRTNLAWRAARLAQERARALGRPVHGLALHLEKHVPGQAGLGGGSADAAAALLGACRCLGLDPDDPVLVGGLGAIGSDCPFFLVARDTGVARCTGRGERVEPLTAPQPLAVVVVTPDFGCSTAAVYAAWSASGPRPLDLEAEPPLDLRSAATRGAGLRNDLAAAACVVEPRLERFRALLQDVASGRFLLSGSGSSFFALASSEDEACALADAVRRAAEARRCGLRGLWATRSAGHGVVLLGSKSQYPPANPS